MIEHPPSKNERGIRVTGLKDIKKINNNTGTTHYDSLQGSKDRHNEVIMTSLQGQ